MCLMISNEQQHVPVTSADLWVHPTRWIQGHRKREDCWIVSRRLDVRVHEVRTLYISLFLFQCLLSVKTYDPREKTSIYS
ncbi:hypothetical protein WN55_11233 [Dufourea novaeangliae]|uniref:Uncharacterized protein n=1 Tax=Dufourea novaeangliae TaxID=178035 RepID=A0A154PBL7_DUFNO|nr:hypothetical protein WN55_11233 [Dufourea novaeangliae]